MNGVQAVKVVSDGILVEFADASATFFSSSFLAEQKDSGNHPNFLPYDPSPTAAAIAESQTDTPQPAPGLQSAA